MVDRSAVLKYVFFLTIFLHQSSAGKHILQKRYRCELDGDGSRRGSIQYLFDGDDFFSLDLTTGTWTAANARAENFITEWDPKEHQAKHWKNYLNNNCIETLMQYVQYRTNTEERKGTHTLQYITDITTKISYTVGELDEEQFVYYGSNVTEIILKTKWIKKFDANNPNYRKREKHRMSDDHGDLQDLLNQAVKHLNQNKSENKVSPIDEGSSMSTAVVVAAVVVVTVSLAGVFIKYTNNNPGKHILQKRYRCELDGDGSRRGSIQYLFDGDDFFSLDLTTGTWTAANARAENFITEWDPKEHQAKHWKNYLNNNCIETLMQYVQYRTNTEERKGTHTLQYITDITTKISYTVGELDEEQFVYYGSNVTEIILKTKWIKKFDANNPNYRKREKHRMSDDHGDLQDLLNQAVKHLNQNKSENKVSPIDEGSSTSTAAVVAAVVVVTVSLAGVFIKYTNNNPGYILGSIVTPTHSTAE